MLKTNNLRSGCQGGLRSLLSSNRDKQPFCQGDIDSIIKNI
jgi:hypothetical protein